MSDDDERLFTRQLSRAQLVGLDAVLAVGYTIVLGAMVAVGLRTMDESGSVPAWAAYPLILAMGAPLTVRRLWPVPVFVAVFAASVVALILGVARDGFVGAAFALYLVAVLERRPRHEPTVPIAVASTVGFVALLVAGSPVPIEAAAGSILIGVVALGGAWTIGRAVRERRRLAERSAAGRAERAVADERLRIARDLHDVIAHGLSLIVVKAATANHVASARPEETREALQVIETTGRTALGEMRQMLDVLRSDTDANSADLGPAPTLDQLPALAERVAMAGVEVDLYMDGVAQLPDGLALAVYRIVQEALTNVVKHAAPTACRVAVTATETDLCVEVVDDGLGTGFAEPMDRHTGRGLIGIRERVRLLGGEFEAGPRPDRGFRVTVRIPSDQLTVPTTEPA